MIIYRFKLFTSEKINDLIIIMKIKNKKRNREKKF